MGFSVLVVCTGNICRSAAAEWLLRDRLSGRPDITVSSAGVSGLSGWGIDPPTAAVLAERGVDPHRHAARRLDKQMITGADLILTAEGTHRSSVLRQVPAAMRRTFTLREFARLGRTLPPADGQSLVERVAAVAAQRGQVDAAEPGADDIGDPFGITGNQARITVGEVAEAVDGVLAALGLNRAGRP